MDYTKRPLDYPQILQILKIRGLIVRDEIGAWVQRDMCYGSLVANQLYKRFESKEPMRLSQ